MSTHANLGEHSQLCQADELKTPEEAATILNMKPSTLAAWRSSGRYGVPFIKVGKSVRYRRTDLYAWLDSRTKTMTGAR